MTDFNSSELTIDQLYDRYDLKSDDYNVMIPVAKALTERRRLRDFYLDLAEQLDAEGLVVVPRQPTVEMQCAAQRTYAWYHQMTEGKDGGRASDTVDGFMWEAMIAAAPLPASPSSVEG